ncbi:hypothetical protein [Micromonospora sp. RL09-050-HVF-A]|uniref:hypothetical protein n=1 Tax=Micromonospora sp. RL09-050-HVF-A TaxID=1703433 RepID=UPI002102B411|nr:hypothetical protein [Micromonospora sp. RL09-050-HVF-A]
MRVRSMVAAAVAAGLAATGVGTATLAGAAPADPARPPRPWPSATSTSPAPRWSPPA